MNAPHEEAVEFAKVSKRENRVYVGNLSYDVKYRDLMEFMRGGGWGNPRLVFRYLQTGGVAGVGDGDDVMRVCMRKEAVWPAGNFMMRVCLRRDKELTLGGRLPAGVSRFTDGMAS